MRLIDKRRRTDFVKSLPRYAVAAEIGVAYGGFSLLALENATPKEYHMVDCWKHQDGAYEKDPCNLSQRDFDKVYKSVLEKFNSYECEDGTRPDVTIHRKYSRDAVTSFPDNYFDWVYIDADHTYEGIKEDLVLWWPKVKPGGYLAGHDYHDKVKWVDVKRGVDEFLVKQNLKLNLLSKAKYPDWAVQKPEGYEAGESQVTGASVAYPLWDSITMAGKKQGERPTVEGRKNSASP